MPRAFDEPLLASDVRTLGERHIGAIEQMGLYDPGWADGWLGLIQLVVAYCMFQGWESEYGD